MTDEQQLYEKIEDYLLDRLPEEEAWVFTFRIEQDPALKALVEQYRLALQAMQAREEENLSKRIGVWKENMSTIPAPPPELAGKVAPPGMALGYKRLTWLKWAAVTIPLIMAGVWLIHVWNQTKPQEQADVSTKKDTTPASPTVENPAVVYTPNVQVEKNKTGVQQGNNQAPGSAPASKEPEDKSVATSAPPDYSSFTDGEYAFLDAGPSKGKGKRNGPAQTAVRDTISAAAGLIGAGKPGQALLLLNGCNTCDPVDLAKWRGYAYYKQRRFGRAVEENKYWYDNGFFKNEAQWYLLLSCIANDKKPEDIFQEAYHGIRADSLHKYHEKLQVLEIKMAKQGMFLKK